jgi:hypothetical protein
MRKEFLLLALIIFISAIFIFISCGKNSSRSPKWVEKNLRLVPLDTALTIAASFNPATFFDENNPQNHSPFHTKLTGANSIKDYTIIKDHAGNPAIYIINFTDNNGFVFVSADYQLQPILAFIERGEFKQDTAPSGLIQWANKTVNNIEIIRQGLYDNSTVAKAAWQDYYDQQKKSSDNSKSVFNVKLPPDPCAADPGYTNTTTTTVGPLLPVTWGQDCSYNNLCPNLNCNDCSPLAVTGCVATAMAQIINYWQPANSYNYNYASMPATQGNGEVQRLMQVE